MNKLGKVLKEGQNSLDQIEISEIEILPKKVDSNLEKLTEEKTLLNIFRKATRALTLAAILYSGNALAEDKVPSNNSKQNNVLVCGKKAQECNEHKDHDHKHHDHKHHNHDEPQKPGTIDIHPNFRLKIGPWDMGFEAGPCMHLRLFNIGRFGLELGAHLNIGLHHIYGQETAFEGEITMELAMVIQLHRATIIRIVAEWGPTLHVHDSGPELSFYPKFSASLYIPIHDRFRLELGAQSEFVEDKNGNPYFLVRGVVGGEFNF